MRLSFILIFAISPLSHADSFNYKASEFEFARNQPVHVLELQTHGNNGIARVCCANLSSLSNSSDGRIGLATVEDTRDCSTVEAFGQSDDAYITRSLLSGRKFLSNAKPCSGNERTQAEKEQCTSEQMKLKGKTWTLSDSPKAIVTRLKADVRGGYIHICRLQLRPLERVFEVSAPTKTLFCKPLHALQVQDIDNREKLVFDKQNRPVMIDTVVCPLPRDCVKPEWEIVPTMQFIPGVDDSTVHADTATSAVVHTGTRPAAK